MFSLEELFCRVDDFCQTFEPQWEHQLLETVGVQLSTKFKRNMKNRLMPLADRLLLRKRAIIESIIDQLKNISQIEHSHHRSLLNCLVNIVCG